jgi:parallel beta-helix repeat protein
MRNAIISFLCVWAIICGCLMGFLLFFPGSEILASAITITVPDDYPSIQDAIDNASSGDTVYVRNGTYYENLVINITIDLIGEGYKTTVIDSGGIEDTILISEDSVTLMGFTITNGNNSGLTISSDNNIISNNNISNNPIGINILASSSSNVIANNEISRNEGAGIDVMWIWISGPNQHIITNNNISYNRDGISLDASQQNTISHNNITNNENNGIHLEFSSYNEIKYNNITHNDNDGIYLYTPYFFSVSTNYNTITNNMISDNDDDGIYLSKSLHNTISNNIISNNEDDGISLSESSNNIITHNNVLNNRYGIYLTQSSNTNQFTANNVLKNYDGVYLSGSGDNIIYHNNIIANNYQANDDSNNNNKWNNSYPSGGNYWSDYEGIDLNSTTAQDVPPYDGIGDTPYVIDTDSQDNYPLMKPVNDSIPPIIESLTVIPNPQELGLDVNISVNVTDNIQIDEVWVNITDPEGDFIGNFSMIFNELNDSYYFEHTYLILGNYTYNLWACDKNDNWVHIDGNFETYDTTPPIANAGSDILVEQGAMVMFNGSYSSDTHRIDNWTWSFEYDNRTITLYGITPSFGFGIIGNYSVILTVSDPSANSANDILWVYVSSPEITDEDEDNSKGDEESLLSGYWWAFVILAAVIVISIVLILRRLNMESEGEEIREYLEDELNEMNKKEILQIAKDRNIKTTIPKSKIINLILKSQDIIDMDSKEYYAKGELQKMKKSEIIEIAREREIKVTKKKEKLINEILKKQGEID